MTLPIRSRTVAIPIGLDKIHGDLVVPQDACGIVIFAHGSGSSRFSPRNKYVAQVLNDGGIATLLIDLLTPDEEAADARTSHLRFDIPLLSDRLLSTTHWLGQYEDLYAVPLGYFGASTGAAAALVAAVKRSDVVSAVVSRGGRPDLADQWLSKVRAPTLLIVGEYDDVVIELNRKAAAEMRAETRIEIVPRATHLFAEKGALEQVASLAQSWFLEKLAGRKAA